MPRLTPSRYAIAAAVIFLVVAACSGSKGPGNSSSSRGSGAAAGAASGAASGPSETFPGGPIGYIGCSNTHDAVGGYEEVGGKRFWPIIGEYKGGTVLNWSGEIGNPSSVYWSQFKSHLAETPTKILWFQFCSHPDETEEAVYTGAVAILAEVQRLDPGATVYVSPINGFVAPHVCDLTGPDGPTQMKAVADRLAAEGKARRGPDIGDLYSFGGRKPSAGATAATNQTADDCHPNAAGRAVLGANLRAFPPFAD
jgi:hypothetical protein